MKEAAKIWKCGQCGSLPKAVMWYSDVRLKCTGCMCLTDLWKTHEEALSQWNQNNKTWCRKCGKDSKDTWKQGPHLCNACHAKRFDCVCGKKMIRERGHYSGKKYTCKCGSWMYIPTLPVPSKEEAA